MKVIGLCLMLLLTGGCGQRGPLFLPDQPADTTPDKAGNAQASGQSAKQKDTPADADKKDDQSDDDNGTDGDGTGGG